MTSSTTAARQVGSWRIELEHSSNVHEVRSLERKLDNELADRFGSAELGEFAVFARDSRHRIVAGLSGLVWGGCCELTTLWVDEDVRGQGIATSLLSVAETDAVSRGCHQVVLFTHGREPPSLYVRRGYAVAGVVRDYPKGTSAFWLRKELRPG